MKFHQLAIRNIRGNLHRYAAFFLSSVFSVTIFFLYAQFILHPDVRNGTFKAAALVRQGMVACEYIIVIFSFFFVLYSLTAFLKSRSQEFGLYSLFGMTGSQIRRMVLIETFLIAVVATTIGIGLGLLFSDLFLMALSHLLQTDSPVSFRIVWEAVGLTYAVFLALFVLLSGLTLFRIGSKAIVEQLKETKKPKAPPLYSKWLSILAALTIGAGYLLAYTATPFTVFVLFFPVIGLVVLGTYFLFSQASVACLRFLKKRKRDYKGTRLLVVSQLMFKIKDNARMLFMVTTLSAVALTASGTLYVFYQDFRDKAVHSHPHTLTWYVEGENETFLEKVKSYLAGRGIEVTDELQLRGFTANLDGDGDGTADFASLVISESRYNEAVTAEEHLDLPSGSAVFVYPHGYERFLDQVWKLPDGAPLHAGPERGKEAGEMNWTVRETRPGLLHTTSTVHRYWLVIDDADYEAKEKQTGPGRIYTVHGLELKNWKQFSGLDDDLSRELFDPENVYFQSRIGNYYDVLRSSSLTLFLGTFVCILFFLASGSMIYFKMFTELQHEQAMYRSLSRIGLTEQEMRKIVRGQLLLIFFVPLAVGAVHTGFAMKALANLLVSNLWGYALTVGAVYFLMQSGYYWLAQRAYLREIFKTSTFRQT